MGGEQGRGGRCANCGTEKWVDKVIEVLRAYDKLMMVTMLVGKEICRFISAYAPLVGCERKQKEEFYDKLSETIFKVKDKELVFVAGDFNGHVGIH